MAFGYRESSGYEDENSTYEYEVSYQYLFAMLKQIFPDLADETFKKIVDAFSVHSAVMNTLKNKIIDETHKGVE